MPKKRIPATGVLAMLTIPISFIALQVVANARRLVRRGVRAGFGTLYLLNFAH